MPSDLIFKTLNTVHKGVLKITDRANTASITLFGQYTAAGFHFAKSGAGTAITYTPPATAHAADLAAAHGG